MLAGYAFGRTVQVSLGTRTRPNIAVYGNANGPESSPLRIGFDVKKNIKSAPNTGAITIYNLAPQNRNSIVPGMNVTVVSGYAGQLQVLFIGIVDKAKSARTGPDVVTTIECLDGAAAITNSLFMRQYGTASRISDIFHDIALRLGSVTAANPPGLSSAMILGVLPDDQVRAVLTLSGTCRDILTKLCEPRGLEWSIQNGALQIIPIAHHSGQDAQLVNQNTGLIGVPSINKDLAEFSCLLNPNLVPGRIVFLNSRDAIGYFKIRGGKFTGDTHDGKWQADIEAVALPDVSQILPADNEPLTPGTGQAVA